MKLLLLAFLWAGCAGAHQLKPQECSEAGDFIANAARAHHNGMSEKRFMERLDGDLQAIRVFPKALRWFAQDESDAMFLRAQAQKAFNPKFSPLQHRARFMNDCMELTRDPADENPF